MGFYFLFSLSLLRPREKKQKKVIFFFLGHSFEEEKEEKEKKTPINRSLPAFHPLFSSFFSAIPQRNTRRESASPVVDSKKN